jgi:hypothetical protein
LPRGAWDRVKRKTSETKQWILENKWKCILGIACVGGCIYAGMKHADRHEEAVYPWNLAVRNARAEVDNLENILRDLKKPGDAQVNEPVWIETLAQWRLANNQLALAEGYGRG